MLEVSKLSCTRGDRNLFRDLSFTVESRALVHIAGANGSGKTSLLRILCGLSPASKGQVIWPGPRPVPEHDGLANAPSQRPDRAVLHYLGHALGLKSDLSACENLCADAQVSGRHLSQVQALQALQAQGLISRAHLPVRVLSQGQRQGVALARLRTSPARLWVLDEPLVGLDAQATATARALMQSHVDQGGAIVMTSHHDVQLKGPGARLHLGGGVQLA
jgi:heme exporter protein A